MDNQQESAGQTPPAEPSTAQVQEPAPVAPAAASPVAPAASDEEIRKANALCIWSLVCMFGAPAVGGALYAMIGGISSSDLGNVVLFPAYLFIFAGPIAAWILEIVALVKYKNAKFPKVLIWIYVALAILKVIGAIIAISLMAYAFGSCLESLHNLE